MRTSQSPLRVGVIGCGAIGYELVKLLHAESALAIAAVAVRPEGLAGHRDQLRPLQLADKLCFELPPDVDLVVEIGGHSAIAEHVLPALRAGVSCVLASVGALADEALLQSVRQAAREGGAQVQVIPGAIGGIDALAAARLAGLQDVVYTGAKPPGAWRGTPAETVTDLDRVQQPVVIFEGSARDAARLYPRNANVTATIALAGLGFDATRLRLLADPSLRQNTHRLQARGGFGEFDIRLANEPLAANPKTSALTVYSALRAVLNRVSVLSI